MALAALAALAAAPGAPAAKLPVQTVRFAYTTHDGRQSYALVLLPGWYGRSGGAPAIPLVIAPHGRNTTPEAAAKRWYDLPTRGGFAVVLPAGWGRVLQLYSWGYPGQIDDLAGMPALVRKAVPQLRVLPKRIYAIGASMGGQEALDLLAHSPRLLAGVIAFDPAVDLANRYYEFRYIPLGLQDQARAQLEVGGTPAQVPQAYAARSPVTYLHEIARSRTPVQLWWSIKDQVIVNQANQAGRFYEGVKLLDPRAPVTPYVGTWPHTREVSAFGQLPVALARIGLLPAQWLVQDPYRPNVNHGLRTFATTGRQPSDTEVAEMVQRADRLVTERLDREQAGGGAGWWRWAFLALLAVTVPLVGGMALRLRRLSRVHAGAGAGRPFRAPWRRS